MGLYAMGKTAAMSAIIAALDARTSTLSDGSRSVDLGSLRQWLADQGSLIVSADVLPANRDAAAAVLGTIDANQDTQVIASYIDRDNWRTRGDWPTPLQASSNPAFISAVTSAMADMDYAVRAIEAVYEGIYASVPRSPMPPPMKWPWTRFFRARCAEQSNRAFTSKPTSLTGVRSPRQALCRIWSSWTKTMEPR